MKEETRERMYCQSIKVLMLVMMVMLVMTMKSEARAGVAINERRRKEVSSLAPTQLLDA